MYSVHVNGQRLSPLFRPGPRLAPVEVSRNGHTLAYIAGDDPSDFGPLYVSRADGSGLRQIAGRGGQPAFSPNSRLLAFVTARGISIVGANGHGIRRLTSGDDEAFDWSPDGKALVFMRVIDAKRNRYAVVVQPLRGKRRVLVRTGPSDEAFAHEYQPKWSPTGRWIAYINFENNTRRQGLTLVHPDGTRRHRVVIGANEEETFQWSPDGQWLASQDGLELFYIRPNGAWHKISTRASGSVVWSRDGRRLAFSVFTGAGNSVEQDLVVARGDGRRLRRLRLGLPTVGWPVWSPDGRQIAFMGSAGLDPTQIWVVRPDGHGRRRLTNEGSNDLVGWTRLAPVLSPASPNPPTERVLDARSVATDTPVAALSADGSRVAFAPQPTTTDCEHIVVWTPGDPALQRLGNLPAPCFGEARPRVTPLALAGSRAAWVTFSASEENCSFSLKSAALADRVARLVSEDETSGPLCSSPDLDHVRGDGDLLVSNDEPEHPSSILRLGAGTERCGDLRCTTLRTDAAPVDSVSSGLIATREPGVVTVLDGQGNVVRTFPFTPADISVALLDGPHLVVWRFGTIEMYDVATGDRELSVPLPSGYRIVDVDGGVAVLLRDDSIMLLELRDGRSRTLTTGDGPRLADLESPGLYYSYVEGSGGRVVFMPRSELF